MKKNLLIMLVLLSGLSTWAQTNLVKRTVPFVTNYCITYFPKDAGVLIEIPNYKSKYNFSKHLSFNETQKWEIKALLEKYLAYSTAVEENKMKFFSKDLGSIPEVSENLKWAIGLKAAIYVSEDNKSLLVLEFEDRLMKSSNVIVLDWNEAHQVNEFIKMIPEMQKEASGTVK